MIRNASLFRTAVLLFSLAASIAPSTARASYQNSAAEAVAAAQAAAEQAAAEAVAAFEACEARFDAALASRDVVAADAALRDLFAARSRLDAAKPDAGAVSRYRSRYDALQSFKNKAEFARKSLEAALSGAEADAAEGTWPSVQSALRRIDADLSDAQTLLKEDELASAAARATKLRDSLGAWQASQASREREVAEAAAIRGEIARADRLLARVAAEQDFDAADRRISEATSAIDGAEARAKALTTVPVADLQSSIAELRADAKRARDAVAANRATAGIRARVAKIVREVNALPAGPESQPDMARLDAECDQVRKDLEADKRVPAAAATELSDLLRTSRERIARMRGALDAETAKRRVADALSAAEQSVGEAGELVRAGQFDDADAAIKAAGDSMSQMAEALKAVPDAAWRNEMGRRGSLLQARLERASKAVAGARASAALEAALLAARANIKSMPSESWPQERARIIELSQSPDLPAGMRAMADARVAELDSAIAYNEATGRLTDPIKKHIDDGDFNKASEELQKLLEDLKQDKTLSPEHRSSLDRETEVLKSRIESEKFWHKMAFAGSAVGVLLLVLVGWAMLRRQKDGMAADLRTARERKDQKVKQLRSDRDRSTASDAVRTEAIERLANFDRIESSSFSSMVPGAADASLEWQDASILVSQLAVIGEPDAARALLEAAARRRLIPGTPILKRFLRNVGLEWDVFVPLIEGIPVRLANGARALEAAHAWTEVWRVSSPAVRDLVAKDADHWFSVAVHWLPGHEDVPALYAQAEFKRDQGNADGALKLLVGEGNTAEQRIKTSPKTIAAALQCKVFLLAANIKLDMAGVVRLQASGTAPASAWPVVDQYAANLQPITSNAGSSGARSSGALIADAREFLRRADQALVPATPGQGSPYGGAASAGYVQSNTAGVAPAPRSAGSVPSLRFQIDAAQFRAELGGGHQQAENALQRVLQEGEPLAPGVIISLSAQSPRDARLSDGWSSLQPLMDRGELSADDCRVVRDMRLNWVNWCIDRGNMFGSVDRETRMRFFRKAAWLTCRYWLLAGKLASSEQWVTKGALARMASTILAVEDRVGVFGGTQRSKALGDSGWNPARDQGSAADDRAIFAILVEIVGADSGDAGGKESTGTRPGPGGTGGGPGPDGGRGPVPPPPAPKPSLSNVWLVPGTRQQSERVEGKDVPVFGSLRIVDPTMSTADVEGAYAWIDIGGGDAARAMGVFGFELTEIYKEPLRVVQKAVNELDASGSPIIGFVNQLADLTFDGLAKLANGFKVVLSRPKPPSLYESMGGDSARLSPGELLCSPIALDRDRIFAPTPARQPPAPVKEDVIERSLLEISMFIAAVGVDAKPMPQVVGSAYGQYGVVGSAAPEAWLGIVRFFREQLGRGLGEVKDEIVARSQKAAGSGLVAAQAPFADSILDEQFIRLLVQQFCCRADELRYVDAASAWQRMDPSLKSAMERLVRRFDERNPNILNRESLKKHFGIDLGGTPPPAAVGPSAGGAAGPVPPVPPKPAGPDPNPLRAEFEGIVRDLPHREVGDFWPFATSREALLGTLQDMIDNLQGLSLGVSPERRAGIGALIDRIRALQGKLR